MPGMKLASIAIGIALVGCQNGSQLDNGKGTDKSGHQIAGGDDDKKQQLPPPSGSLEDRVRRLEEANARYAEALDFLQKVYDQQKQQERAQREQREREELAPDGTFAVEVASDVKGGQVEGPNTACVTLVEAWDFA
jgi:hypothetical protein